MGYFASAFILLLQTVIGAIVYVLMLRLILQKMRANYHNPLIQLLVKLSDWIVKPFKRVCPNYKGYDFAVIVPLLGLSIISALLLALFHITNLASVFGVILVIIAEIGKKLINIYFFAIIMQSIISWIPNLTHSPVAEVLYLICEPLMLRTRKLIPPVAGFDLSPIPLLIALYILNMFVFTPLMLFGVTL